MPAPRVRAPRHHAWARAASVILVLVVTGCAPGAPSTDDTGNVVTSAADASTPTSPGATAAPTPSPTTTSRPQGEAEGSSDEPTVAGEVPESGSGRTSVVSVPGEDTPVADAPGRTVRYTVEIEGGLETIGAEFPAFVHAVLTDDRGWQREDGVRFVNVSPEERKDGADTDLRIRLSSPALTDEVCAPLRTNGRLSCHDRGEVMINAWRWVHGADTYGDDLENYRIYLVNHEVGHSIGHGHVSCPGRGENAPVMLQQTLRLEGCTPYPYPR